MTIETIADMVWALGHDIDVKISDPEVKTDANYFAADDEDVVVPTHDPRTKSERLSYEVAA
ncbi:UNVERIFIED_ORG: hypothetical protein M2425_002726 [Bradyrhizobium japonicum]